MAEWHRRSATVGLAVATVCWTGFVVWSASDNRILVAWAGPAAAIAGVAMLGALIASRNRR